jgi:hypothetical protein
MLRSGERRRLHSQTPPATELINYNYYYQILDPLNNGGGGTAEIGIGALRLGVELLAESKCNQLQPESIADTKTDVSSNAIGCC